MKKFGFTLAEVLITLVIIGIIASITIPALMNNTNDEENIAAYKKALSVMNQALRTEYALEGNTAVYTEQPIPGSPEYAKNWKGLAAIMAKRANIVKYDIEPYGNHIKAISSSGTRARIFAPADGMIFAIPTPRDTYTSCPLDGPPERDGWYPVQCGHGIVDVNGKKGPNKLAQMNGGKITKIGDTFKFSIHDIGVLPGIIQDSTEARLVYGKRK